MIRWVARRRGAAALAWLPAPGVAAADHLARFGGLLPLAEVAAADLSLIETATPARGAVAVLADGAGQHVAGIAVRPGWYVVKADRRAHFVRAGLVKAWEV